MLNIDTNTMMIAITRGDSASITFGAKDKSGTTWNPTEGDETLTLSVSKKWGGVPLMEITNPYDADPTTFWTINIDTDDWLDSNGNDKFKFADYVYDVQVGTSSGAITIIGKTDDLNPTFRVWGESAEE